MLFISRSYRIFLLLFLLSPTLFQAPFIVADDMVILPDLVEDAQTGNIGKLIEHCGVILSGKAPPETMAKAYTMLAIAYILRDSADSADKCAALLDLLPDDLLASPAVPIIKFLSGKSDAGKLRLAMKDQPDDWRTVAVLCELIADIKTGDMARIRKSYGEYKNSVRLVRATDWSAAWSDRVRKWYAWVRSGKGNPAALEKLVVKRKGSSKGSSAVANPDDAQALQKILTLYLDGKVGEARKLAFERRDSGIGPVMRYLAGDASVSPEAIFKATSKDAGLWALASLGLFLGEIASKDKLEKSDLIYHLKNFEANVKAAGNDPRLAAWKSKAPAWRKWCESGFKTSPELPRLLRAKSVDRDPSAKIAETASGGAASNANLDITTISLKEFAASRKPYAKRPKLVGLQCPLPVLQKYFDTLPKELKRNELRRYKTIRSIKEYIIRILERNPYPYGLILKRRRKISGIVTMANEKYLIYRKGNRSRRCYWKDLSYKQYAAFMKYYAKERTKLKGVGKRKRSEILADASNDYLGLAMLYDWYKQYKAALYYARKAVSLNKKNKNAISAAMLP